MTDYRAELQRLVQAYDEHGGRWHDEDEQALFAAVEVARAALPQTGPEGVTDQALASFTVYFCRNYPGPDTIIHDPKWHAPRIFNAAAYAIARFGCSNIEPVAERSPWTDGPIPESELAAMWNQQADSFNQWESLDSGEQLAWAQAQALARIGRPAIEPVPTPTDSPYIFDWF